MAVDVSRIPNNNKFDPVREAILDLQTQLEEEGQIAYDGTLTLSEGTAVTLTGGSTFTANQSSNTTITIGVDLNVTTNAASGGGALSYLDGEFTYTPPDLSSFIELTDLSITTSATPSGGGALSYDDTTGVFTFTPADAGTGLTLQQVTANGNTTNYGISTGNITVQPSGTGSGVVTIQANSVGDARLDLTAGTGGTGVIKTTNDVAITFEPNATEKVVIASDGNMNVYEKLAVGKTTAASTYHLEVDGTALANNFITSMTASGTTYTGTFSQYYNALQIRTVTGGTISLGGSGPLSVQNNVAIKDGDLDVNGDVTADFFIGDGSQLTNIAGTSSDLQDVTDNGATTTNDISTGRIKIANNVSTGGFSSFDDYQLLLYKNGTSVSESYGMGVESNNFMFNSDDHYRFYVDNAIKVTINSSGNISATSFTGDGSGLTSVDADTLDGYQLSGTSSVSDKIFNNKGLVHKTFTDFNTVMNAGANYLQGGTNSPTGTENHQWYGFMLGLGSDYNTTTGNANGYASQLYWNRQSQGSNPYLWARDLEAGTWGSWRKMSAGNADNANTLNGVAGSSFLRSDADDTATGKITINNNSNSISDPTLTISSSDAGGGFGRLMFSGSSTVAGVINRGVSGSHLYFDEIATTGDYIFRSSGRAYYYGNLTVGSTNDTEGKLVVRGDANSGMVSHFKNLDTGTTSYAEVIVRSVDSSNDLRLGTSKNYVDTQWQGGWVFAPRKLLLKSNNDVNIFAGGTDNSNIVSTFTSSLISLNTNTEVTGKITITGSPAIELTGSGTGTYNKTVIYNDQTYGFLLEGTKATNSGSAAKKPITLTWRGGFNSNGGLNLTGDTKLVTTDTGLGVDVTSPIAKLHVGSTGTNAYSSTITKGSNMKGIMTTLSNNADDMVGIYFATGTTTEGTHWSGITGSRSNSASDWGTQLNFYTHNNDVANINDATQKMVIKGDGNVGIGTTSPNHKLTIDEGTGTSYVLSARNTNDNLQIKLGTTTGGYANIQASTVSGNAAYNMSLQADGGSVGIGTTSPTQRLDVNGYARATSGFVGSSGLSLFGDNSSTQRVFITTGGNVGIGTTSPSGKFEIKSAATTYTSAPAITFTDNAGVADSRWIIGNIATNYGSFNIAQAANASSTSYTPRITILNGGNVGIGTTTPSYKLDVNGSARVGNYLTFTTGTSIPSAALSYYTNGYVYLKGGGGGVAVLEDSGASGLYVNDDLSANINVNNSAALKILSNGNVGIGTTSPSAKLDVNGIIKANGNQVNPQEYGVSMVGNFGQWQNHSTYTNFNTVPAYWGWNYIQGNTNAPNSNSTQWYRGRFSLGDAYGLGTSSGDYWMEIAVPRYNYAGGDAGQMFVRACEDGVEGSWYQVGRKIIGDFTATGDVVAYGSSDRRLKDNITPIPNALDKVNSIGGYEFDWNDNQETYEGHDVGVIAQEVEEVMPEVVTTREDGYKAVKYEKLVPLLIEAIKEQQKQIDELKAIINGGS